MLTALKRLLAHMKEAERTYRIGSARQIVLNAVAELEGARRFAEQVAKRDAPTQQILSPLPPEFHVVWGYNIATHTWERCWFCWAENGPRWVSDEDGAAVAVSSWAPPPATPESTT